MSRSGVSIGYDKNGSYYRRPSSSKKFYLPLPKGIYKSSMGGSPAKITQDYHAHGDVVNVDFTQNTTDVADSLNGLAANVFSGSTNPWWKDQIRAGINAGTDAFGTQFDIDNGWFSTSVQFNNKGTPGFNYFEAKEEVFGNPPVQLPFGAAISDTDYFEVNNRAIRKFLAAAEAVLSSIEGGQDLGEYKESLRGMVRPLSSLRTHVLSYPSRLEKAVKGYKRRGPGLEKAISDTYLEFRFGWNPLAADLGQAYAGLVNNHHFVTVPVKGSAGKEFAGSNDQQPSWFNPSGFYSSTITRRMTSVYTVRYIGSVWSKADSEGRIGSAQALQLDLPHVLPTVWDLIPYSFIVDYFTNIGDIIRAASFITSNIRWANRTDRQVDQIDFQSHETLYPTAGEVTGFKSGDWQARVRKTTFQRFRWNPANLSPVLQFSLPLSERPWENIGAILASRLKPVSRLLSKIP